MLPTASPLPDDLDRYFATTVALITTHSSKGDNVMSAEWTFNISYHPMLVAVFVNPHHATHDAILESKEFGVNMACEEQYPLASFAGGFSRREANKLTSGAIRTRPGTAIKARMIEGSLAQMECKLVATFKAGDHTEFVGEVVAAQVHPERKPLVLFHGYWLLGEKIPRGHHLFLTITPEGASRARVDGFYYAEVREGERVALEAFDAEGRKVAQGTATTDRGGYFEWRPEAAGGQVVRVVGATPHVRAEAQAAPA